eukprot:7962567-Alexandrium_andersonii.AAC.1
MSASLVGSEMCIRDRFSDTLRSPGALLVVAIGLGMQKRRGARSGSSGGCLLYTSDAADDM